MVYNHPRAYFLGGEDRWQLTWYDLEQDCWGVCQVRLGAVVLYSGECVRGTTWCRSDIFDNDEKDKTL
jgi:hypothetical protein